MAKTRAKARGSKIVDINENFVPKNKKNKIEKKTNGAAEELLKKNQTIQASMSDLLKLCRPCKVRLTQCVDISKIASKDLCTFFNHFLFISTE